MPAKDGVASGASDSKMHGARGKMLEGGVESNETWIGEKERDKHKSKKSKKGRRTISKQAVMRLWNEAAKSERNRSDA